MGNLQGVPGAAIDFATIGKIIVRFGRIICFE